MKIQGKTAFVTGSGKRVGREITETLLSQGVNVAAHYRTSRREVEELVAKFGEKRIFPFQADLRNTAELREAFKKAVQHFGKIEILINCASDFYPTPSLTCTEADWDHFLSVNLKGQFFLAQSFANALPKDTKGSIINLCDVNSLSPRKNFVPYIASKAGLLATTKALALEWGPQIRVNAVSPGPVLEPETYTEEQKKRAAEATLLKKWGTAKDISAAVVFLLENEYVTGFELKVDGGRSLRE